MSRVPDRNEIGGSWYTHNYISYSHTWQRLGPTPLGKVQLPRIAHKVQYITKTQKWAIRKGIFLNLISRNLPIYNTPCLVVKCSGSILKLVIIGCIKK